MYKIDKITADPKQTQTLLLTDGSVISLSMEWKDVCLGWFITNITFQDFVLNGMRITTSPNMLRQFKNVIQFGLCCLTEDNQEPNTIQDFVSGRASLYLLTADDVQAYEDYLSDQ